MLSEALQRNAKYEARLSNISDCLLQAKKIRDEKPGFTSLRMTFLRTLLDLTK